MTTQSEFKKQKQNQKTKNKNSASNTPENGSFKNIVIFKYENN